MNKPTAYLCGHTTGVDCSSGQVYFYDFITFDKPTATAHAAKNPQSWTTKHWFEELPFVMPEASTK